MSTMSLFCSLVCSLACALAWMRRTACKMRTFAQALCAPPGGLTEATALERGFGFERRDRSRVAVLVDGDEGKKGMGGDGTLAGPRVFGQDLHLDLHRGMGRVADLGAHDDEFLHTRGTQKVQSIHGGRHHGAAGVAGGRGGRRGGGSPHPP